MSFDKKDIDQVSINYAKSLIMDTVRNANSGHTGGPLSSLDFTYILFKEFLKFDPENPNWINRDRFVLSVGHESALIYVMLYYIGWLELEDLKSFRQLGSKTPGHPERTLTPGIEATTGPLGQGVGNAVGMAVAENILSEKFSSEVVNHYTYVLHGDGDIQEPVAQGSIACAGHWGLGKLIAFYDSNDAQISGKVSRSDSTDYKKMYESHGWHVQVINGHDHDEIRKAIRIAQMEIDKPSVIIGETIMAYGTANVEGDHNTHGAPLSHEEIKLTKKKLGLDPEKLFQISDEVLEDFRASYEYAKQEVESWNEILNKKCLDEEFKESWDNSINLLIPKSVDWPVYNYGDNIATRKVWGAVIEEMAAKETLLVGGSADLEPSNVTAGFAKMVGDFTKDNHNGMNFPYGVREFPMGVINNGIAQHGGLFVFGATFFVFADYERPAIRLRALQGLPAVSEFTHDSIYVGEDGPTHQPIEQLSGLRSIPNLNVFRPADTTETYECWELALKNLNSPSILALTRQKLNPIRKEFLKENKCSMGAYEISRTNQDIKVAILASGSEVNLAQEVSHKLATENIYSKVVSVPCQDLFKQQSDSYKDKILNETEFLITIEAGSTSCWQEYIVNKGINFGIDDFGKSAPYKKIYNYFGLTVENIAKKTKEMINK